MKNIILKATAYIMGILWIVSACMLDSASLLPFWVCCGSGAWLALFAYANGMIERH